MLYYMYAYYHHPGQPLKAKGNLLRPGNLLRSTPLPLLSGGLIYRTASQRSPVLVDVESASDISAGLSTFTGAGLC